MFDNLSNSEIEEMGIDPETLAEDTPESWDVNNEHPRFMFAKF